MNRMEIESEDVVKHLRGLASGEIKPKLKNFGLCHELVLVFGVEFHFNGMEEDLLTYEYYSGSSIFPIDGGLYEYMAYRCEDRNMWDADDEYGMKRLALCNWFADYITAGGWLKITMLT